MQVMDLLFKWSPRIIGVLLAMEEDLVQPNKPTEILKKLLSPQRHLLYKMVDRHKNA